VPSADLRVGAFFAHQLRLPGGSLHVTNAPFVDFAVEKNCFYLPPLQIDQARHARARLFCAFGVWHGRCTLSAAEGQVPRQKTRLWRDDIQERCVVRGDECYVEI
jgi:hypothetical protein